MCCAASLIATTPGLGSGLRTPPLLRTSRRNGRTIQTDAVWFPGQRNIGRRLCTKVSSSEQIEEGNIPSFGVKDQIRLHRSFGAKLDFPSQSFNDSAAMVLQAIPLQSEAGRFRLESARNFGFLSQNILDRLTPQKYYASCGAAAIRLGVQHLLQSNIDPFATVDEEAVIASGTAAGVHPSRMVGPGVTGLSLSQCKVTHCICVRPMCNVRL